MVSTFLQSLRAKPAGVALLAALALAACGGGGGGASPGAITAKPVMSIAIVDGTGAPTTAISTSAGAVIRATVKTSAGEGVPNAVVLFNGGQGITFSPSNSVLTDGSGVAAAGIIANGSAVSGAVNITADTNVGGQPATVFIGVTVTAP